MECWLASIKLVQILAQLQYKWNVSWGKIIISHLCRQLTKMGHNYHFIPCLSTSHGSTIWRAMQVGGLPSTIRFALLNLLHVNQLQLVLFYYLFSVFCILICLCLFRGWEQAHQRKEESTLQILRNTGNILFGKMNRMGRPLSWHLVRRR